MGFFDNDKAMSLAQGHINEVSKLEEDEAKLLLKRYSEIRRDLRDRLDSVPGDTFTAQRLRSTLIQVDEAVNAMNRAMTDDMRDSTKKTAVLGSEHLIRELNKYDTMFTGAATPININSALVAQDTSNLLVERYSASLDAYSADIRNNIYRGLSSMSIEGVTLSEATRRLGQFFQGEEWKLMRLARTELHNVYGLAKQRSLEGANEVVGNLQKTLIHPMDSRTADDSKFADALNLIVDVDKPFKYTFKRRLKSGESRTTTRIFMTPPDRPNDRSIMVPYKKEWDS